MSITGPTAFRFFWLTVFLQWLAISWALTPPIDIYSNKNILTNSSADQLISLQTQSNVSTVANQTNLLSFTAPTSFRTPPDLPWLLKIGGTPYLIQFTNFKEAIPYYDVLDLLFEAQFDIMREMAVTYPSDDQSIGQSRVWTSDTLYLAISSDQERILHSICGLYLAAMVRLWGIEYGFHEADLEFLGTFGRLYLPEVIGRGKIGTLGGTVES